MAGDKKLDIGRRRLLAATAAVGGVGVVGAAVPFVASMLPSERAKAAGAPVEVDLTKIPKGQVITVAWRGKPVWVVNRTKEMLASLKKADSLVVDPNSNVPQQPPYCKNEYRSIKPEWSVLVAICTHLGCIPNPVYTEGKASGLGANWPGGYLCPCHGSEYDMAGRVFKDKPAPINLLVPPYEFLSDTKLLIGEHEEKKEGA